MSYKEQNQTLIMNLKHDWQYSADFIYVNSINPHNNL
jgi:hypothetical protein